MALIKIGILRNFLSTGIDDNATSNALTIDANENATFANSVTASSFSGDGSALTGIVSLPDAIEVVSGAAANSFIIEADGDVLLSSNLSAQYVSANLNASELTSGTIPDARFPSALPAIDGSALTNFSNYSTTTQMNTAIASSNTAMKTYVDNQVAGVVDSAPATLDTLNELAAALGDDANFATTTATSLGNRLRVDTAAQGLTGTQQSNARTNLGLGTAATTASTDYATAAQGTNADTAHGWGNHANYLYLKANSSGYTATLPVSVYLNEQMYTTPSAGQITIQGSTGNLTASGKMIAKGFIETKVTAASGTGTKTFNLNNGASFEYTGTGAGFTAAFSNVEATNTTSWTLKTTNSGTITWPAGVEWSEGTTPAGSSGTDVYSFISIAGTIYGSLAIRNAS